MERYRILYSYKIVNNLTQNCGLTWKVDSKSGLIINTLKCKQYENSCRMQSFQYMGPRLFNALPGQLRTKDGDYKQWKSKLDLFLADIPDHPITMLNESGLCDIITARPTNSLIRWIPYLGLSGRREGKTTMT